MLSLASPSRGKGDAVRGGDAPEHWVKFSSADSGVWGGVSAVLWLELSTGEAGATLLEVRPMVPGARCCWKLLVDRRRYKCDEESVWIVIVSALCGLLSSRFLSLSQLFVVVSADRSRNVTPTR